MPKRVFTVAAIVFLVLYYFYHKPNSDVSQSTEDELVVFSDKLISNSKTSDPLESKNMGHENKQDAQGDLYKEAPKATDQATLSQAKQDQITPIMLSAFEGNLEQFRKFVAKSSSEELKLSDKDNQNLVHWATMGECLKCLEALVSSSSNINFDQKNLRGETALVFASSSGNESIAKLLLEKGADPNIRFNKAGYTLLHDAAFEGHIEVSKQLIIHGANINAIDDKGQDVLIIAAKEGHFQLVELLLENEKSQLIKDNSGKSALDYAKIYGFEEVTHLIERKFQ